METTGAILILISMSGALAIDMHTKEACAEFANKFTKYVASTHWSCGPSSGMCEPKNGFNIKAICAPGKLAE